MSRIYDALQAAARDSARLKAANQPNEPIQSSNPDDFDASLLTLNRRIESMLPNGQGRIVAFAGAPNAEDASKLVDYFAKVVARGLNKKVLVVKAGEAQPGTSTATGEPVIENPPVSVQRVNPNQWGAACATSNAEDSPDIKDVVRSWREQYDWVFIDPADASSNDGAFFAIADGIVIVVESEKARWQSVRNRIEEIRRQGRVLGVILNKQRHYIPDFIYRRL